MAGSSGAPQTVVLDGHRLRLTHPDKVLYPETGTTKAEVIQYLVTIAPTMLPHLAGRIVTRKRWVHGVGTTGRPGDVFFEKNLPDSAPSWIRRQRIQHSAHDATYPVFERAADLAWAGQVGALELHVPQWRVPADSENRGGLGHPDRLVLDLDPGPGAGLAQCAVVAHEARALLEEVGLTAVPVTSGSKGLHLYAALDGTHDSEYVNAFAKTLAQALEAQLPKLVVSSMTRSIRQDKVLVDWSQNNGNKTTISPYSLRGTTLPHVAAPRDWDEIGPDLEQLLFIEVLDRVATLGDPLAALGTVFDQGALEHRSDGQTPDEQPGEPSPTATRSFGPAPKVMLASTGREGDVRSVDDWAFEMKWDGIRAVATIAGGAVRLTTRNGNDATASYPEVVEALTAADLGDSVVDGEIVAFDESGAPNFGLLQLRMGVTRPLDVRTARRRAPAYFLAFDLLEHDGSSLRQLTYDQRREALEDLGVGDVTDAVLRVPPRFDGHLDDAIAVSREQGLEGVLAKRRASRYRAGRSQSWVKIKHLRTQDVVICGWCAGSGSRHDTVGSLVVGVHRDGELSYAGRVGTGFTQTDLTAMTRLLERFATDHPPITGVPDDVAREAHWVTPRFVGEVTFAQWTASGQLRHSSWRGLRDDVSAADVSG